MVEAPYRCPSCGSTDPTAYVRCQRSGCPDGRDPRPDNRIVNLERQIAELRAEVAKAHTQARDNGMELCRQRSRAEAAEAENARLRALPLKDEVERVLELLSCLDLDHSTEHDDLILETCVKDARALLSRLRAGEQEGWRDISSAPKDGTKVVLAEWDTWNECWRFGVSWWRKYLNEGEGFGWMGHKPTHWQPLPAAPSEQRGDRP